MHGFWNIRPILTVRAFSIYAAIITLDRRTCGGDTRDLRSDLGSVSKNSDWLSRSSVQATTP
ncbi:hypothetical protein Trco_008448 [Trichoderma cornu-damae]|uniref:Uncharacterized protein n=1 Tax=Trichoderma cornu-damae TaxID=654480 RepID=A0A9P8QJ51_9HYPO|nr:hypothetical protein Trco_008448 [Trichoderma cornu-damae]